jgi:ribosome modulation factor
MELRPLIAYEDDPRDCEVHHPFGAYCQGFDAFEAGYPANLCPYVDDGSRCRDWWLDGWRDAWSQEACVVTLDAAGDFDAALAA